jgi:hypothetical protein
MDDGPGTAAILARLEAKVGRPRPIVPARIDGLPDSQRAPIVRLLQCFQLGESSEGRVVGEARRTTDRAFDEALKEATALYVREEGRHAAILAQLLAGLGAPTRKRATAEVFFRRGRRLLGLRTKMLVIAAAEVVGVAIYTRIRDGIASPVIASALDDIVKDELDHLEFQSLLWSRIIATFGPLSGIAAPAIGVAFAAVLTAATLMVTVQHHTALRQLGTTPRAFARECMRIGRDLARETVAAGGSVDLAVAREARREGRVRLGLHAEGVILEELQGHGSEAR